MAGLKITHNAVWKDFDGVRHRVIAFGFLGTMTEEIFARLSIEKWCQDNCQHPFQIESDGMAVWFNSEEDAALFMVRFS